MLCGRGGRKCLRTCEFHDTAAAMPELVAQQFEIGAAGVGIAGIRMAEIELERAAGTLRVAGTKEKIAEGAGAEGEIGIVRNVEAAFGVEVIEDAGRVQHGEAGRNLAEEEQRLGVF